ncbi:hypothetical protein UJ101_00071 [Flavobacteriaceae bacterium UJ101]|nr:hypothetical protein UJ101_00071 [Flavobacteriaceae bacterium UJ101]
MKRNHFITFIGILAFLVACKSVEMPGISKSPTHTHRYNQVVWHDLITPDIQEAKDFYGSIFGWTFEDFKIGGKNYVMISHHNEYIGGMIEMPSSESSIWIASISMDNIDEQAEKVVKNGGKILLKPITIPGRGRQVILEGNQGEKFSLINSSQGDASLKTTTPNGNWLWMELWANDTSKAHNFYNKAFYTNIEQTTSDGRPYWIFKSKGKKAGGMIQNPLTNVGSQWIPYIQMDNPSNIIDKIAANKGYVILKPEPSIRKGSVGIFQDPKGAIICLQSWNNN